MPKVTFAPAPIFNYPFSHEYFDSKDKTIKNSRVEMIENSQLRFSLPRETVDVPLLRNQRPLRDDRYK